jgi:hypothetical protein
VTLPFHEAAGSGLITVASKLSKTKGQFKRNLATLYEAGAISGDVFAWCVKKWKLENV